MHKAFRALLLGCVVLAGCWDKVPGDVGGPVDEIFDGDTLRIGGYTIRLYGIDAPEYNQACLDKNDMKYPCGWISQRYLKLLVGDDHISCQIFDRDKWNRLIGVCRKDGINLNAIMVRNGWAIAYSHYSWDYLADEVYAQSRKLGIWQGWFEKPWKYREE
jgi:endonuclease YncB( thermonuclease family)